MSNFFYLQDTRQIVGNDFSWWAESGGYTTDISKAETFTRKEAFAQHENRGSDRPWPVDYIDKRTRPVIDYQVVDYEIAMQGLSQKLKPCLYNPCYFRLDGWQST